MQSQQVQASQQQLQAKLTNFLNQSLPISEIVKGSQTLLVFVRHFNCYVCRDQVKNLNNAIKQEDLQKNNKKIIVIACSKADAIQDFSKDTGFPKENIFVSTDLEAYKAYGMKRAENFSGIKGQGTNPDTKTGVISGMAWYLWKSISRGSQGDVYQLGGEVLFEEDGRTIQLCKANQSSQDYLSAIQIKELLRV